MDAMLISRDRAGAAVEGSARAMISSEEVRRLVLAANRAWREQRRLGLTEQGFDAWRRGALWDAVRRDSFRSLGQREFGAALGHFERLAGGDPDTWDGRFNRGVAEREASGDGDRRRAEFVLRRECRQYDPLFGGQGCATAYAVRLLEKIHRTSLPRATSRQIWQTVFTLRSRAAKKEREARS